LGCDKPTQAPANWLEKDEEWYNCPLLFICQSANDFMVEYDMYCKGFAQPLPFGKQSSKFYDGVREYESLLRKFTIEKQGKENG